MMGKIQNKAIVRISGELLCDMLFPKGTKILDIKKDERFYFETEDMGDYLIKVSNPGLPKIFEGEKFLTINPTYKRVHSENKNELDIVEFVDWGIKGS